MKYALASQRKIRLADARSVDIELPSRAISLARGHLRVSRFARRTTEKRETARSLPFPLRLTID